MVGRESGEERKKNGPRENEKRSFAAIIAISRTRRKGGAEILENGA